MSVAPWVTESATALPSLRTRNTRTRGGAEVVSRRSVLRVACAHMACFACVLLLSYGFFALMGHSLHSAAYKTRANSELRTEGAKHDVYDISRQVSSLVSTDSLDRWARMHGFVRPGTLVAMQNASQTQP